MKEERNKTVQQHTTDKHHRFQVVTVKSGRTFAFYWNAFYLMFLVFSLTFLAFVSSFAWRERAFTCKI